MLKTELPLEFLILSKKTNTQNTPNIRYLTGLPIIIYKSPTSLLAYQDAVEMHYSVSCKNNSASL